MSYNSVPPTPKFNTIEEVTFHHNSLVWSACFSPNGQNVITGSQDGTAKLWDLNGNLLYNFGHAAAVKFALFSPNGKKIIIVCADHTARLLR